MPHPCFDLRRFSSGERLSQIAGRPVWKFDAVLRADQRGPAQATCYIREADKGLALRALFARCPGATIYGTGLPLTGEQALIEAGHILREGEILVLE